jgi:hypothetical protein
LSSSIALICAGLIFGWVGLRQRDGVPVLLPYNWVAILFPPIALGCAAIGLSLMVDVSGR